jgi:hypothetical protein
LRILFLYIYIFETLFNLNGFKLNGRLKKIAVEALFILPADVVHSRRSSDLSRSVDWSVEAEGELLSALPQWGAGASRRAGKQAECGGAGLAWRFGRRGKWQRAVEVRRARRLVQNASRVRSQRVTVV